MRLPARAALLPVLVLLAACADPAAEAPRAAAPEEVGAHALARPSKEAARARSEEAQARLNSTEAGRLVQAAISAHGGLERWYGSGPLLFRYRYERAEGPPIDTRQVVDPWAARARHATMPDSSVRFGWTGRQAWVAPAGAEAPINARFWSLTPYYFVGMPFVLADPGVNLETAGQMAAEGQTYSLVRVTFDPGTGDAPDDYYYVLLDPQTRRVGGVRYVVSYPGFYAEGEASPERLMLYDGAQDVGGLSFQRGFRSFAWTEDGPGAPAAEGAVTDMRFLPEAPDTLFALPENAAVQDSL